MMQPRSPWRNKTKNSKASPVPSLPCVAVVVGGGVGVVGVVVSVVVVGVVVVGIVFVGVVVDLKRMKIVLTCARVVVGVCVVVGGGGGVFVSIVAGVLEVFYFFNNCIFGAEVDLYWLSF